MATIRNIKSSHYIDKAPAFLWWCTLVVFEVLLASTVLLSSITVLFIIFAFAAILPLLVKPEYAIYSMVILLFPAPILAINVGIIPLSVTHISIIVGLISWVIATLARTRSPYPGTKCDLPLILFGVWALLSLFWSHNLTAGFEDIIRLYLAVAAFFLVVALVRTRKTLLLVFGIIIFMGVINACLALYYPYTAFAFIREWNFYDFLFVKISFWPKNLVIPEGRACGFGTAHNTAAIMVIPITFAMMQFFVTQNVKKRWVLIFIVLVLFAGSIVTLSKGPLISLIIGAIFVLLHLRPLKRKFFTTLAIIFMITLVFFTITRIKGLGMATSQVGSALTISSDSQKVTSLENRITAWTIGAQKLWDTGGFGTGIGGTNQYLPFKWIDGAHPVTLFDLGFVGFAAWWLFLLAAYQFFKTAIRNCRNEYFRRMLIIYLGGYITILISWFISFSYIHVYLWFYLGIGFAICHLAQTASEELLERVPFSDKGGSIVVV